MSNESGDTDEVVAANYMKANDPYEHPVSHSFVYADSPQVHDIAALDFTFSHLYEMTYAGNEFIADTIMSIGFWRMERKPSTNRFSMANGAIRAQPGLRSQH